MSIEDDLAITAVALERAERRIQGLHRDLEDLRALRRRLIDRAKRAELAAVRWEVYAKKARGELAQTRAVVEAAQAVTTNARPWPQDPDGFWTMVRLEDYDALLAAWKALDTATKGEATT